MWARVYIVPYPHEIPSLNSIKTPLTMVGREHSHALRVKELGQLSVAGNFSSNSPNLNVPPKMPEICPQNG